MPWLGVDEVNVRPAGSVSVTRMLVLRSGPPFVTVIVKDTVLPGVMFDAVLVRLRSETRPGPVPRSPKAATPVALGSAVATRVVAVDLAAPEGAGRLAAAVEDLEIGVLVNNAGFGSAGRFERQDEQRLVEMIRVHCTAPLVLTHRLLPKMRSRGRGAVVFTGSLAAKQPMPLHATYAATKAFAELLGEGLWAELRGSGVDVLVVEPGTTATEFQAVAGEVPHEGETPEHVVAVALERLGEQPSVAIGWWRWLRGNLGMRLLPRSLLARVAHGVIEKQTPPSLR